MANELNAGASQLKKFEASARELGCNDDQARIDERVLKLVKAKPALKAENPDVSERRRW